MAFNVCIFWTRDNFVSDCYTPLCSSFWVFSVCYMILSSSSYVSSWKSCGCIYFHLFLCPTVLSLQELCCRAIVARTTVYGIEQLPLPTAIKSHLKSYAMTSYTTSMQHRYVLNHNRSSGSNKTGQSAHHKKLKFVGGISAGATSPSSSGSPGMDSSRTSCTGRNSCSISWTMQMLQQCTFWLFIIYERNRMGCHKHFLKEIMNVLLKSFLGCCDE